MSQRQPYILPRHIQTGLTLVELMIAMAINLVVVLVAAYLYLNGRSTQQAVEERAALFENGQMALELIGREIGNAGFYPAHRMEPNAKGGVVSLGRYTNPLPGTAAFDAGVFGCVGQIFKDGQCQDHEMDPQKTPTSGDGLVLNYFTDDAFSLQSGGRADCQGSDVVKDPLNAARAGGNDLPKGRPPAFPLFVSNRYSLTGTTLKENGKDVTVWNLACTSNANVSEAYQPLVPGIEQFRVRYGIRDAAAPSATQYIDANEVSTLSVIPVGDQKLQGWQRVVSVQVCVVASSRTQTRFNGAGASTQLDCYDKTLVSTDNVQRRRFVQVFGLKNQLTQSYSPGG